VTLSFVAAGLLALGALALGPVLAHLARQTPVDRKAFGAMMLVERLVRRLRRQRRLRDRWLLLLRMLAVLAVVAGVAGPQLQLKADDLALGGTGRIVVILDTSMSMRHPDAEGTLFERAKREARAFVKAQPAQTRWGLVRMASEAERVTPVLTAQREEILAGLDASQVGRGGTELSSALRAARALLAGEPGDIVVFSDEAGALTVLSAREELERVLALGSRVVPRWIGASPPMNLAVSRAVYGDGLQGGSITVDIANFGVEPEEVQVSVLLPDESEMTAFVPVPPGSQASESFTVPPEVPGGVAEVRVVDDGLQADDVHYFHLPRVGASRVLVVDGSPGPTPIRSEVFFLERALAPWGGSRTGVTPDVVAPAGVGELDDERYRVVFLANVANPASLAAELSAFVRRGGNVVISAGENVTPDRYNSALSSLLPAPLRKARNLVALDANGGVAIAPPDTEHPLFSTFEDRGRAAFGDVYLRRAMTFEPFEEDEEVTVLLRLENGLPALVERKVGRGRLLFFVGTVDLAWGNWPLQASFMPWVQRTVGYLGGESAGGTARFNGRVGEPVLIPLPEGVREPVVNGPAGRVTDRGVAGHVSFTPDRPGAYSAGLPGAPPLAWIAVNVPPAESDIRRPVELAAVESEIAPELFARSIPLGPGLLLGALALLCLQAFSARSRAPSVPREAA